MNTPELIPLSTTLEGLAGNTISLYGPETRDFEATFDHTGVALVPVDVAATSTATPGFHVDVEHFDIVATYNARQLELARAPIPSYDAGEPVYLHIPSLAGVNGIQGLDMVAGDNVTVVFDGEGKTECGEKTALTFLASFPDSIITLVNAPPVEVAPKTEIEDEDESEDESVVSDEVAATETVAGTKAPSRPRKNTAATKVAGANRRGDKSNGSANTDASVEANEAKAESEASEQTEVTGGSVGA